MRDRPPFAANQLGGTDPVNSSLSLALARPSLRWIAGGVAVGLLTVTLLGAGAGTAQAQTTTDGEQQFRTISVNGVGRVMAAPDVADISIGVYEQAKEASDASQRAAESMDSVIQALLGLGIAEADIQTTSLTLNPRYDWNTEPAKVVGWEASNIVDVTVRDIDSVGTVVDTAVAAGANQINGITFRVEDPTEAEAIARSSAVADARAKADQLAADAGVEIIGIVSISESTVQPPQPFYMERAEMAMAADAGAVTPVLGGEVELTVNVFIQYEISA
jgi:uncharacterized protein YggE